MVPRTMLGFFGVIARDTSVAGVTVSDVDPETLPKAALIVVAPAASDVARPLEPAVLLMVAMDVVDELQVTEVVRSWVVLSENVPVAINCLFVPDAMLGSSGVTARDTSVAAVTLSLNHPETFPQVILI